MVELLAPARDFASINAAINNGADSIYIGLSEFNMRENSSNFDLNDISKACDICHSAGVKLYVCTNIIMKDSDIEKLDSIFPVLKDSGVDAIIISDLGTLAIAKKYGLEIHMSVQENITNSYSINALGDLGVKRVVLSRELNISEIANICNNFADSDMELEVFIHGAMCMAISGRCFLSYAFYNRSANCGECLQPCRKEWILKALDSDEEVVLGTTDNFSSSGNGSGGNCGNMNTNCIDSNNNQGSSINNNGDNNNHSISNNQKIGNENAIRSYFFSPNDLAMIEHIDKLIDANVDVFKIEGRAKSADYVSTVTSVYREAIDAYDDSVITETGSKEWFNSEWLKKLNKIFNRGYDNGFYFNTPYKTSSGNQSKFIKKDIGTVCNYYSKIGVAELKLRENIATGDEIIIQGSTTGSISKNIGSMEINGKSINSAISGQRVAIYIGEKVRKNDFVYKLVERD
ncbi:MAG: peptidase U32 family protein [Methanobacteriaceae archaeon]